MELRRIEVLPPEQKLVVVIARILFLRRKVSYEVKIEDVLGVMVTHPMVMKLVDACGVRESAMTPAESMALLQSVQRNMAFRERDFFVSSKEIVVANPSERPAKTEGA